MKAGKTSLDTCVSISVDPGVEQGIVQHCTDVHPLAMPELLARHCELWNFPVFSPAFNSCSVCAHPVPLLFLECVCQAAPGALECAVLSPTAQGSYKRLGFSFKAQRLAGSAQQNMLKSEPRSSELRAKRSVFHPSLPY